MATNKGSCNRIDEPWEFALIALVLAGCLLAGFLVRQPITEAVCHSRAAAK